MGGITNLKLVVLCVHFYFLYDLLRIHKGTDTYSIQYPLRYVESCSKVIGGHYRRQFSLKTCFVSFKMSNHNGYYLLNFSITSCFYIPVSLFCAGGSSNGSEGSSRQKKNGTAGTGSSERGVRSNSRSSGSSSAATATPPQDVDLSASRQSFRIAMGNPCELFIDAI